MTHYLEKKTNNDIPIVFPSPLFHENKHSNFSEKNRFQKMTQIFSNLKYLIESNEENEKEYVKEVRTLLYNSL